MHHWGAHQRTGHYWLSQARLSGISGLPPLSLLTFTATPALMRQPLCPQPTPFSFVPVSPRAPARNAHGIPACAAHQHQGTELRQGEPMAAGGRYHWASQNVTALHKKPETGRYRCKYANSCSPASQALRPQAAQGGSRRALAGLSRMSIGIEISQG